MYRILQAKKEDLKEVARLRLLAQVHSDSLDPDTVLSKEGKRELEELTEKEFGDARITYLLAKNEKGQSVALAILSASPKLDRSAHLGELFIEEKYRDSGLGTRLVVEARKVAKKMGVSFLRTTVHRTNVPAQRFYKKLGFLSKKREYILLESRLK